MPLGYGLVATGAGQLPWSWVEERLGAARNYWVVTSRADGRPHAMPVWGLWLDGAVYFSTDPASRKGRNLAANPAAVIHLESGDDVVICEGPVESTANAGARFGPDLAAFVDGYDAKYGFRPDPGSAAHGVYRMRPAVVMAWREVDFPATATRWSGTAVGHA